MFLALAGLAATPVPTITPSPSPTATAVAHAAAQVATTPGLADTLNSLAALISQPDVIAIAGIVAVSVQGMLNKFPFFQHAITWIQDVRRIIVSIVLPFLVTGVASLASGHNDLGVAPWIFLVGQIVFYVVRTLRKSGTTAISATASSLPRTNNP